MTILCKHGNEPSKCIRCYKTTWQREKRWATGENKPRTPAQPCEAHGRKSCSTCWMRAKRKDNPAYYREELYKAKQRRIRNAQGVS